MVFEYNTLAAVHNCENYLRRRKRFVNFLKLIVREEEAQGSEGTKSGTLFLNGKIMFLPELDFILQRTLNLKHPF